MQIRNNIKVAIMCTIMPFAIGYMLYRHSHIKSALITLTIFLSVAFLSLIIPKLGEKIYKTGEKAGHFIGKYIAIIILFICYITVVIPTGLLMKIVKRDRLRLKKPSLQSYWIDYENKETDYEYQF